MYQRHEETPVYQRIDAAVDAEHFNRARRAYGRLGRELRLELPGLRTLDLILQHDAWVVVDRRLNDLPVIAWSHFETEGREALHLPIRCRIRLYHANGAMLMKRVLRAMEQLLTQRLDEKSGGAKGSVIPFDRPKIEQE